jgi:hypothetical protein
LDWPSGDGVHDCCGNTHGPRLAPRRP